MWQEAFGYADKDARTAPAADTMYGIGSVSKMLATVAVMKLADRGEVDLDRPLCEYLPSFRMPLPMYRQITVRMLLDHSSGLPGSTYGDSTTGTYFPGYLQRVLDTLAVSRMKTTPGLLSVYCNDGFTLTEALVAAVTGKSFAQYVHDEVLAPLGMDHSAYPLERFPDGAWAKGYAGGAPLRFEVLNVLASGGLYSTPSDMSRLAAMFIGGGTYRGTRILSAAAVAEMAESAAARTFLAVPSKKFDFGLGWDTVTQPGLAALGVTGWSKGGDSNVYHAAFTVAPKAKLAVTVTGVLPLSSDSLGDLAEDILVHALADQKTIKRLPKPLPTAPLPVRAASQGRIDAMVGYWGYSGGLLRVGATPGVAQDLTIESYLDGTWDAGSAGWKLRSDGLWHHDRATTAFGSASAGDRHYLVMDTLGANGFYRTRQSLAQKLEPGAPLSAAWRARAGQSYLAVNAQPDADEYEYAGMMLLRIADVPGLPGYVTVTTSAYGTQPVDAGASDDRGAMFLQIPGLGSRDLEDAVIEHRGAEDWVWWGDLLYRPRASVPELPAGTATVTLGDEGYAEYRAVPAAGTLTVTARPHGPLDGVAAATGNAGAATGVSGWILFGPDTTPLARGSAFPATVAAPEAGCCLLLFGSAVTSPSLDAVDLRGALHVGLAELGRAVQVERRRLRERHVHGLARAHAGPRTAGQRDGGGDGGEVLEGDLAGAVGRELHGARGARHDGLAGAGGAHHEGAGDDHLPAQHATFGDGERGARGLHAVDADASGARRLQRDVALRLEAGGVGVRVALHLETGQLGHGHLGRQVGEAVRLRRVEGDDQRVALHLDLEVVDEVLVDARRDREGVALLDHHGEPLGDAHRGEAGEVEGLRLLDPGPGHHAGLVRCRGGGGAPAGRRGDAQREHEGDDEGTQQNT